MIGGFTKAKGTEDKLVLKSLGVFTAIYVFAVVLFAVVQALLDFDMKSADGIVSLMVAANFAGSYMVNRVKRMPEKEERFKLQIGSLVAAMTVQLLFAYLVTALLSLAGNSALADMLGSLPVLWVVGGLLFLSLLYYGLISWSIGSGAKTAFKNLPQTEVSG